MSDRIIHAKKGNESKEFDLATWDMMPVGKYGWVQAAKPPKAVLDLMEKETAKTPLNVSTLEGKIEGDITKTFDGKPKELKIEGDTISEVKESLPFMVEDETLTSQEVKDLTDLGEETGDEESAPANPDPNAPKKRGRKAQVRATK